MDVGERTPPSLVKVILFAVVIFGLAAFAIMAFNTGDILWFWPVFEELPVGMVIHCYGQDVIIKPGEAAYEAVNTVLNESLTGSKRWDSLSMSDITYTDYLDSPTQMALEVSYDPPVRFHSIYKFFKRLDTLVIPLVGRHADKQAIFGRLRENTLSGSYHVGIEDTSALLKVIQEQGLCLKP